MTEQVAARGKLGAVVLLYGLFLCAVYADSLFLRRNFTGRDLLAYNLPMEKTIHDAYARGRLPLWSPHISGGRPLLPNPNAGALYPPRMILSLLPFPLAMRLFPLLHWFAAGVGMILLTQSLRCSLAACWIGAVTYTFSGVVVSEVFYPHILPGMALLPWILWRLQARSSALRTLFGLALLLTLDLLAADVFTIGIALVAGALWILFEETTDRQKGLLAQFGMALGLAVLMAAPQIVATALWIPETNRGVLGMKIREATLFSISPFRLLELVIPFPFGPNWRLETSEVWAWPVFGYKAMGIFLTLYAGALALIALARLVWRSDPGLRFSRWLLAIGVFCSVIPSLIPAGWRSLSSPLPLRNPEKFAVMIALGLAVISARGFDSFRQVPMRGRAAIGIGALLCAATLAAYLFPSLVARGAVAIVGANSQFVATAERQIPASLAEGGLLWMITLVGLDLSRGTGRSLLCALLLLTLVPVVSNRRIIETSSVESAFAPSAFALRLRRADPGNSYRTLGETIYSTASPVRQGDLGWNEFPGRNWRHHTQTLWDRGTVFNYDFDAGDLARVESLRRISATAALAPNSSPFFGSLCLRWGIRSRDQPPVAGYHRIGGDLLQDWDEHERAYPDIRLVTGWREAPDSLAAWNDLPFLESGEIVLETGRRAPGSARPGRVRILEKSAEQLRLETSAPDPTWLFVLRAFWNHRTVMLDGQEVEYHPAQLAFSAVAIPAGVHRVEWRERLPGGSLSVWFCVACVAIGIGLAFSRRFRTER